MAEEIINPAPVAAEPPKTEGKLVSRGTPVAFNPHIPKAAEEPPPTDTPPDPNTPPTPQANDTPKNENGQEPVTPPPTAAPDISDDTLRAFFEKQGIPYENIEKLKEKLSYIPPAPLPTDDEKIQAEIKREKQLLDEHISRKGTVDQFATFKNILSADKKILGFNKVIEDYVKDGFTEGKAVQLANEMYFQKTQEEIDEIEDDAERAEAIKKKESGLKKLENKGAYLQKTVKDYFDDIDKGIADREADKSLKEKHTANVADAVKNFQRKEQIQLGQLDGVDITPFDFEFPDEALNQAKDYLSDRTALEQKIINQSGEINISELLPHLARSFAYTKAIKTGFLTGQHRTTEFFEAKFGSTPPPLGGGSKPTGTPGKFVSAGKPVVIPRPQVK